MTVHYVVVPMNSEDDNDIQAMVFESARKAKLTKARLELLDYAFLEQKDKLRDLVARGVDLPGLFGALHSDFEDSYVEGFNNRYEIVECDVNEYGDNSLAIEEHIKDHVLSFVRSNQTIVN